MRLLFCMIIKTTINKAIAVTVTNTMVSIRVRFLRWAHNGGWDPHGRVITEKTSLEVKKSEFLLVPKEKGVLNLFFKREGSQRGNLHLALLEGPLILFEYEDVVETEMMLHIGVKWFKGEAYGRFVGVDDDKVNSKPLADAAFLEEVLIFQGTLSSSCSSWEEGPSSSSTHFWVPNSSTLGKD
ncbi:hypothetical protein AAG906_025675 [Vitis piasezkii]